MKTTKINSQKIKKITIIGVFVAFAYAVSAILPIKVSFLTLDFKDVISTICGLFFGPIAGIVSAGIVPFIEMMTTSTTKFYGLIMNLISSLTFVGIASVIYKYKKTIYGAILGLVTASVATMGIMTLANIIITPYYLEIAMGMPLSVAKDTVKTLLPTTIIPFNIVKSILNAGLTMLLYKPLSKVLKSMGITKSFNTQANSDKAQSANSSKTRTLIVTLLSALIVVAALVIVFVVLGGKLA